MKMLAIYFFDADGAVNLFSTNIFYIFRSTDLFLPLIILNNSFRLSDAMSHRISK